MADRSDPWDESNDSTIAQAVIGSDRTADQKLKMLYMFGGHGRVYDRASVERFAKKSKLPVEVLESRLKVLGYKVVESADEAKVQNEARLNDPKRMGVLRTEPPRDPHRVLNAQERADLRSGKLDAQYGVLQPAANFGAGCFTFVMWGAFIAVLLLAAVVIFS